MVELRSEPVLARASTPVPAGLAHFGKKRHEVVLRPTADGRYRWFHADGTRTVVEGASVDDAIRVARMVWTDATIERCPPAG